MTPATFVFESASRRTWDDGTTALILTGTEHTPSSTVSTAGAPTKCSPWCEPVSVTVFLGRGDDITENIAAITRALTEGDKP